MTIIQLKSLQKGDKVVHKKYGECEVHKIVDNFGPVLSPTTDEDCRKLCEESWSAEGYPFVELSWKNKLNQKEDKQ